MRDNLLDIGLNGSMLDEQPSGVGVYSFNIINQLSELYSKEIKRHLTVFSPTRSQLNKNIRVIKLSNFLQSSKYGKLAAICRFCWNTFLYPFHARRFNVLISPTTHGSFIQKNQIITIHDLLSLHFSNISFHQRLYFRYLLPFMLSRAKLIITVSEASKRDIIHFLKCPEHKIKVIPNGYDDQLYYVNRDESNNIVGKYGIKKYVLAVGPTYPHKNFEALLYAWSQLPGQYHDDLSLVIAGGKNKYISGLKEYSRELKIESRVNFLGYVPLENMPSLYREAEMLVYPSLHEGFGIPLLEAMACGCPVVSSFTSSMPEVCGEAAFYFNPRDRNALTSAITTMLANEKLRFQLREKGLERARQFSWKQTAKALQVLIETNFHSPNC